MECVLRFSPHILVTINAFTVPDAVDRLKGMFLNAPWTRLSVDDTSRLTGLEPETCLVVLSALEDARFLTRDRDGLYVRRTDSLTI